MRPCPPSSDGEDRTDTAIRLAERTKRLQLGLPDTDLAKSESKPGSEDKKATYDVEKAPYQKPLLFARSDVIGIDIAGSLAQQGVQFVLGYNERSIALIPATTRNYNGKVQSIMGADGDGDGPVALDALSVLGQFKSNTKTQSLGFGIERYFATGYAARNLGDGLGLAIANGAKKGNGTTPSDATAGTNAATASRPSTPTAVAELSKE
ncbi:hypothetical protein WKW79_36820 [Variovorax robiniae]|uniref:Uncharacterized protein n=1 Tax=Variovorax robiniae TaxID=1836199 RepID=A0ABU8XN67_9BURK